MAPHESQGAQTATAITGFDATKEGAQPEGRSDNKAPGGLH